MRALLGSLFRSGTMKKSRIVLGATLALAALFALEAVGVRVRHSPKPAKVRINMPVRPLPPLLDIIVDEVDRPACDAWKTVKANGAEERCV